MPGLPSTTSVIESPTGCTKQLISVAVSDVPAAELMRPAGMKPRSCASRKRASQWARSASASAAASARATRARTSATVRLAALGVLLEQHLARDRLLGQRRRALVFSLWFVDSTGCIIVIGSRHDCGKRRRGYAGSIAGAPRSPGPNPDRAEGHAVSQIKSLGMLVNVLPELAPRKRHPVREAFQSTGSRGQRVGTPQYMGTRRDFFPHSSPGRFSRENPPAAPAQGFAARPDEMAPIMEVSSMPVQPIPPDQIPTGKEVATLGGGCFWCLEAVFEQLRGVEKVESGYTGGQRARTRRTSRSAAATPATPRSCRSRSTRTSIVVPRPAGGLLRDPRPDDAQPPGRRRRHAVPLGDLLPLAGAEADRRAR